MIYIFIALQIKKSVVTQYLPVRNFWRVNVPLTYNVTRIPRRELAVLPLERLVGEFAYRINHSCENHVGHTNTPC